MTRALTPTIGLVGLGFASMAAAQDALPDIDVNATAPSPYRREGQQMPRMPMTLEEAPQSTTSVPREIIQERAATTVRDALRNVTGISLAAGEGGFSGDNLTLRGFSARGDFFIDGIRDAGQYTRDSFFLESVDVLKGPSSIQFGRGSTGGVINQTTRLPQIGTRGSADIAVYTPSGVRSTADINIQSGDIAYRLNAMASRIDAAGRDHVFNERWGIFPSVTFGIGGPTSLTLSYLHQEERNMPDYGIPYFGGRPIPVSTHTFYGLTDVDRERTTTDVFTARLEHRFTDDIRLRNTFRWANYGRELEATAPRIANAAAITAAGSFGVGQITRQPQVRNGLDTLIVNQTELLADFTTLGLRHAVLAGVEIGRESSELVRFAQTGRPNASLAFPDASVPVTLRTTPNSDIKTTADTLAFYAVDRIRIGEMFEVILGARWDSFSAEQANRTNNQSFGRTDTAWSYRGALVFTPVPGLRTYAAYGTSFNPSAESLTLAANNAQLAPESTRSYEAGAAYEFSPGLRLSGSAFRIEKTNARTSDPANDVLQVLDGVVRVDGFEVQVVGRVTPEWNVMAGYTRLNSEIVRTNTASERGREFANVAPNTATLWTSYNLPHGVQVGGGAQFVDRRYGNNQNTNRVPSYVRYDAAVSWTPEDGPLKGLRLQANALNLGDTRTYETVYTAHTVPGTGRTFVFTVRASF
ncbi:MAG: TonB-dependent siderophore receptor [Pseudomonadota bacterium]